MDVPVLWLSLKPDTPARGYWDQGIVEDLLSNNLWQMPHISFVHYDESSKLLASFKSAPFKKSKLQKGAVIVFPSRAQVEYVDKLNELISNLEWVVLMLTGDEEGVFPFEELSHPNMKLWVMSPRRQPRFDNVRFLGTGYPPQSHLLANYEKEADARLLDYFFSGQITHERRQALKQAQDVIVEFKDNNKLNGEFHATEGFTQGMKHEEYYKNMASAKVAPAPSGPETPDSFRLFEALEAGCVPIADSRTLRNNHEFGDDYWDWFFGESVPFPTLTTYDQLQGYIIDAVKNYYPLSNKIGSWWQAKKREMAYNLLDDIENLSGEKPNVDNEITVLVPSSPIPSHPSTTMIEQTIADIRSQLPHAEILIMVDGVREEQQDRSENYQKYIHKLLWLCRHKWTNVLPVVYEQHMHQASMTRETLKLVKTPLVLFVEHDTPVTPDRIIEWDKLCTVINSGKSNVIRLLHEERILPDYDHMMYDSEPFEVDGVPLVRTCQWSQRPHLASTAFYRKMIDYNFHPESRTMIEDVMHGVLHSVCEDEGIHGWNLWRVHIYCPNTDKLGIKRSYDLNGRQDDPKYDMIIKEVER